MSGVDGAVVVVVGVGYLGKLRILERMAHLGAHLVLAEEPGHWSESLVGREWATFLPVRSVGDPDTDARDVIAALERAGIRPDGVLTFWEPSTPVAARVARADRKSVV